MHEAEGVWAEVCMHTLVRLQKAVYLQVYVPRYVPEWAIGLHASCCACCFLVRQAGVLVLCIAAGWLGAAVFGRL